MTSVTNRIFLLVANDEALLTALTGTLQEMNYHTFFQAEDGTEAWAMYKNFQVDFMVCAEDILDIQALTLLRLMRSHEKYEQTHFILLTGKPTAKLVSLFGRQGASAIVVLPFSAVVFKNKIKELVDFNNDALFKELETNLETGVKLMQSGRTEEALKIFEKVVTVKEHPEIYFNMGYIKAGHGLYEEAIWCFLRATRLNSNFAGAYQQMGHAYTKLGKLDQAAICYERAAEIYMDRKENTEAQEIYEAVVKLRPNTTNVYNSLGIIFRRQGRLAEAVKQYQKAMIVNPQDENIYYNLARVFIDLKEIPLASQNLKKALAIKPDFAVAKELSRALEMGLILGN
ncbi:MAG: tetratricopeptide repeat protein [Deltaproteobacteria bacterium]|nr:tetratricopeptide repeat protein [Deltaproteobacteria bacterium]